MVMDPVSVLSIVTGAASLAIQCAQVMKSLHDVSGKFRDAHLTISSALQELETIQLAWERIERLLRTWEDNDGADAELLQRLSRQLDFGDMIMTALLDDISEYQRGSYSFRRRSKIVWNESLFRAHQERIRGQATAMTLLLSVLQMPSAIERKENLAKGESILRKSDESAMSIVPSRLSCLSSRNSAYSRDSGRQSADSSELVYQELSIDNELFTARVYKRNFRNKIMQYNSQSRRPKTTFEADEINYQTRIQVVAHFSRNVWIANVDYLAMEREPGEVTIEGPSLKDFPPDIPLDVNVYLQRLLFDPETLSIVLRSTTTRFNEWKQCFLYEACKQNKLGIVKTLLDHGVWKDGYRPTGTAARLNQTTPMHVATYSDSKAVVRLLINEAAIMDPLHRKDDNGYQPLHIACRQGSYMMVATLIEAGADVNPFSPCSEDQPLHLATKSTATNFPILSFLLKHGANPKAQTVQGDTALHLACMNSSMDKVAVLLAPPEILEIKNYEGWTPLHVACRYSSLGLIRQLLSAGSPTSLKTVRGATPLHVACTRGVLSVVDELFQWLHNQGELDNWSESPLVVAVSGLNFPIVSRLLDAGYYPDFSCRATGKTILQHALSQPCFDGISVQHRRETIETLLAFGANAGLSDLIGNTALHHWAMTNSFSGHYSPSGYFVYLEESRYSSLLDLLVQHGANVEAQNHNGETPMDLAFKSNNMRKLEALQLVGGKVIYKTLSSNVIFQENSEYRMHYPEPEIESFTKWNAGSIPRHDPLETSWGS